MTLQDESGGHAKVLREAILYLRQPDGTVICQLCAHRCVIRPGRRGICWVRENQSGTLVTLVADRVVGVNIDPIEKKPFFHFLPGSLAYSFSTVGCNFHCLFCQNWEISQWPREHSGPVPGTPTTPRTIVERCARHRLRRDCVHLHRADDLLRAGAGDQPLGRGGGTEECLRDQRLHDAGSARPHRAGAARCERRFEELHRPLLSQGSAAPPWRRCWK